MWRHPKYYKELRKRNRDLSELQQVKLERSVPQSDQAISLRAHDGECERSPGPGHKRKRTSVKPQATKTQASGSKTQAPSCEVQASSHKHQAP
jgi:hypothetical protein